MTSSAKPTKEQLLATTVIAGFVTLLVNVAAPWVLHWINPSGPKSSIVEVNGVATRKLPAALLEQFKKAPTFTSLVYNAFPTTNTNPQPFPGMPRIKTCLGQTLLDTGTIDDQCGPIFATWATQTASAMAATVSQIQTQTPTPDRETALAHFNEIETQTSALARTLATITDTPNTKNGDFGLTIVLLNSGDGEDVLFPDATLSCKACGTQDIPAVIEDRYQTVRAHSSLAARVSVNISKTPPETLQSLQRMIKGSPNLQIKVCVQLVSRQSTCKENVEIK